MKFRHIGGGTSGQRLIRGGMLSLIGALRSGGIMGNRWRIFGWTVTGTSYITILTVSNIESPGRTYKEQTMTYENLVGAVPTFT